MKPYRFEDGNEALFTMDSYATICYRRIFSKRFFPIINPFEGLKISLALGLI